MGVELQRKEVRTCTQRVVEFLGRDAKNNNITKSYEAAIAPLPSIMHPQSLAEPHIHVYKANP